MRLRKFIMHSLERGMFLSVSVPLVIAVMLSGVFVFQNWQKLSDARHLLAMKDIVGAMGALVHEQQKERGATSVFLSSGGTQFKKELADQRLLTDGAAAAFLAVYETNDIDEASVIGRELALVVNTLTKRAALRQSVDDLAVPTPTALSHYTAHNAQMLDVLSRIGSEAADPAIAGRVTALESLMEAKESAGIERAIGSGGFAAGEFTLQRIRTLDKLITQQASGLRRFAVFAEPEFRELIAQNEASADTKEVLRLREVAFASYETGDLGGVSASDFFAATTVRINAFKALENTLVDDISATAAALNSRALRSLLAVAGIAILAFVSSIANTLFVVRQMLKEVRRISDAGDRLAKGDESVELPNDCPRELGRIVYSFNFFRQSVAKAKQREAENVAEREASERAARDEAEKRQLVEQQRVEDEAATARQEQEEMRAYVAEISKMVNACARGDFTQKLALKVADGPWAEVSEGLNRISTGVQSSLNEIKNALGHMAHGDMTYQMQGKFDGIYADIAATVNEATHNMSRTLARVAQSTDTVSTSSNAIAATTRDLSLSSEENAGMLRQTTSAIDEMTEQLRSAAEASQTVRTNVVSVSDQAKADSHAAAQSIKAMEEIQTSSEGIVKILSVIDDIAFQTNLLALNAGVEAARAGESGRGFAVVATEVRALAQRSSEAAKEIAQLVEASAVTIQRGVEAVDQTASSLSTVVSSIQDISAQIGEITDAFANTRSNVDRVAKATTSLDASTRENVNKIEAARSSAEQLDAEAQTLAGEVDTFTIVQGENIAPPQRTAA